MKHIFISRHLTEDSPFRKTFASLPHIIHDKSLIQFEAIAFKYTESIDWIFFYSKKGVDFFLKQTSFPPQTKIATLGKATAIYLESLGYTVHFAGMGDPYMTAQAFLDFAKAQKVLFPQAKNSRQSIEKILGAQIFSQPIIVYDNQPIKNINIFVCDILIFTSSLSVEIYYNNYPQNEKQKIIAIGKTTFETLQNLGIENIYMSKYATEEALLETCISLL